MTSTIHTTARTMTPGQVEDAAVQLEHDFVSIIREEVGMNESMANAFAQAVVRGLRRRLGGCELYIPVPDRSERNAAIRAEFDGTNMTAVMRKHGIKRSQFYEIVGKRPAGAARIGISGPKSPVLPLQTGQAAE